RMERYARKAGLTTTALIHEAVEKYLQEHDEAALKAEARRQSLLIRELESKDERAWTRAAERELFREAW
ncbi:MAG: hypothetical protein MUC42_01240, partial [Bryobacter sp.]|nr:hypothetical protein [Bryobacter sp.]